MKDVLERYKKDYWDGETFTPGFQEEFLTEESTLDAQYIMRLHKIRAVTLKKANAMIAEVFGQTKFSKIPQPSELTDSIFKKHYEFGKYPNVRGWITYFTDVVGVHATRKDINERIYKHKPASDLTTQRELPSFPTVNGWRYYLAPKWLLF